MILHHFFLYATCAGAALFIVQIVLSLRGPSDAEDSVINARSAGRTSTDTAFNVLSLEGLTAFLMMLGLFGLALLGESRLSAPVALLGGVLGGAAATYVMARIFGAARALQGSGALVGSSVVGQVGTVYLRIAPDKPGQVTVSIDGNLMTLDATSTAEAFDAGTEVRVTRALSDGSLVVSKGDSV